jgi:hypothetical protein
MLSECISSWSVCSGYASVPAEDIEWFREGQAISRFGSATTLSPLSRQLARQHTGRLRKRDNLLIEEGWGGGGGAKQPCHGEKSLVLYKSLNTLWREYRKYIGDETRKAGGHANYFRVEGLDYSTENTLYCESVIRGLQRDVVYRGWPIAPSYMSPNAGGVGGVAGFQPMSTAVHRSPNKLWRSNSIFNLWLCCRKLATLEADANRGNERADGAEKKIRWQNIFTERHPRFFISYFLHNDKKKSLN